MQKTIINFLKNNKKNFISIFLYIAIILSLALLLKKFNLYGGREESSDKVVKDISVKVVGTREETKSEEDVVGNLHDYTYNIIGFYTPDSNEYKEISIGFLSEETKICKGDRILVYTYDGNEYNYGGVDRRHNLIILLIIFMVVAVLAGGMLGIKSIFSLVLSFIVLIYGIIPLLQKEYNPIIVIFFAGTFILATSLFILYGVKKTSIIAFSGTIIGLIFSLILSIIFANALKLTGIGDEMSVYLRSNFPVNFNMKDLLLGSFLLGTIGVVDDVSMSQVVIVEELIKAKKKFTAQKLYWAAMRVGRSHIASMINTLFMAYFAVSLPMILIFVMRDFSLSEAVNREFLATEIVRTLIGSIALIMSVPITTLLASYFLRGNNVMKESKEKVLLVLKKFKTIK